MTVWKEDILRTGKNLSGRAVGNHCARGTDRRLGTIVLEEVQLTKNELH